AAGRSGTEVIATTTQPALAELSRPPHREHVVVGRRRPAREAFEARFGLVDELLQQDATKALLGSRIPREQGSFHYLGQVTQGEHRSVEVGEVAGKSVCFPVGELSAHLHILSLSPWGRGPG